LIRQKSVLFGDRLVSLPYANHGGPLADTPGDRIAPVRGGGANSERARRHPARGARPRGPRTRLAGAHRQGADDAGAARYREALDQALGAKLRSQCRRALKEGAEVAHGGAELIPEFYRVFAVNMRDLGTPVYPRRWFDVLARHFGEAMRLVVVRLEGRPAAGCVLLRWNGTMEIPWAASLREFNRYSVNMLLYREALGLAIRTGCRRFDFGRSTRDSGRTGSSSSGGRGIADLVADQPGRPRHGPGQRPPARGLEATAAAPGERPRPDDLCEAALVGQGTSRSC
jgi:serine/alanine adding enzyme